MNNDFPFNDAEGAAVTISVEVDVWDLPPTVSDLDGAQGRVIETTTKDAGIVEIDCASLLLDGEQYVVTENDDESVLLYADGREVYLPHDCIEIGR